MFGILNINKPSGWTSRDVVNRVQRLVRPDKAGHAGTLDPLATGVLIVAIGPATRLIQFSHRLPKSYRAEFLLGRRSASDDVETEQEMLADAPVPGRTELDAALPGFLGDIEQIPPVFSAVKVKGQRAYELARSGETVELQPRTVTVYDLNLAHYKFPELILDITCSSGTYVRSLGRDLAKRLGTGAVMSALERTAIGSLDVSRSVDVDEMKERLDEMVLSPLPLVESLPRVQLAESEICQLHHGQSVSIDPTRIREAPSRSGAKGNEIVGIGSNAGIVSILKVAEDGICRPVCNFPQSS